MQSIFKFLKERIVNHWQTTITGVLLVVGYVWYKNGHITFEDFKDYIVILVPAVLLLLKDPGKKTE